MADPNNNAPVDTLELDPADGQQYILELRDRMLELLSPAQSIPEVEERLKKLYPDSKLVDLAIYEAKKPRNESSHKNHKIRNHSSSSGASFAGALHNITSMAVAKLTNLVRDGVVGNKSENELSKYKIALIQFIINDVLKLAENFVKRQKGTFIITRSDIRTAMHADKDLLDMFLSDDKNLMITENHPTLANFNNLDCRNSGVCENLTYKDVVKRMVDSEHLFISGLNLIIKVFKGKLSKIPKINSEVKVLFCNIEELYELSHLILCDLEDAQESVSQEPNGIPHVGLEILDLAQAEEFHAYFTFTHKRLSHNEGWRQVFNRLICSESMIALRTVDQKFDLAIRHLLPNYLLNVIVHFFEFFRNISDLYELSKRHNNQEDQFALYQTISILIKTKRAIEDLLETEMKNEDVEPLDPKQSENLKISLQRELETILQNEDNAPLPYMPPPEIYRFSEPDSRENIQFEDYQNRTISSKDLDKHMRDDTNRTPVIRCATLIKLVERLTYHKYSATTFLDAFLTTYRSFIPEPAELLDLLIERFKVPDPPLGVVVSNFYDSPDSLPECDRRTYKIYIHHFRQNYSKPVKLRVINVLKSWIKNHYYDFERHPQLLQKLYTFLEEVSNNEKHLQGQIKSIRTSIENKKKASQRDDLTIMLPDKPPEILWDSAQSHEYDKFDLLTLHHVEFARQLTLVEFDLFRAIKPSELINVRDLGLRSRDENKYESSPNLSRLTRHFTLFSYWIRKCIVETDDIDKRAQIYSRSIEIMAELKKLNNHTGLLSVGSAIESAAISRLTHTRKMLTNNSMKILEDYRDLTQDHQKKLQQELKSCNPPCIPYLGSYQTKLIHAKEGNKTFIDEVDTTTISPTLSTDGFHSSFSNSPATPISPRTPLPQSTFMHMSSPNPPLSATSTMQNQFFGSPTSVQPQPKMINFYKQRIRAGLVAEISNYQNTPYCLNVEPEIRRFIESIEMKMEEFAISLDNRSRSADDNYWLHPSVPAMTKRLDDYLFAQSEKIEPKNSKPPPRLKKKGHEFWKSPGVRIH